MKKEPNADFEKTVKDIADSETGKAGKVLICATAIALTAVFYWLYIMLYLTVGLAFHDGFEWRFSLPGSGITIGLAFDLVALGVLWRYLTPIRVCRFWQRGVEEIVRPYIQAWKRGQKLLAALAISVMVSPFVITAAVIAVVIHNDKSRPARASAAQFASPPDYELGAVIPCDQSDVSSTSSDGK